MLRKKRKTETRSGNGLAKSPTGIAGLDEITNGGIPRGRPTLVCGGAGSGKTLFAIEFLVRGAVEFGEPGVFIAFEETADELAKNVRSLGFDLDKLSRQKKLAIDYVHVERCEILESGEYDLEGLFIRIAHAVKSIGAKRIVLDTVEALFAGLSNDFILRGELRRLFRWLKDEGLTAVITAERGVSTLTRQGLEEYVSDCVILLDHRVIDQMATRRMRVVKYRGTIHGTNEYPFLIDKQGFSVLPVTGLSLEHQATSARLSSGIPELDAMLGGKGYFRGSTVLITGTPGTGKTSMAAHFVDAACRRGERCSFLAFEESESQILRNMRSIGLDLGQWLKKGLLQIKASRPTLLGLEMHLVTVHQEIEQFRPRNVVIDPITDFEAVGSHGDAKTMLLRIVDFLKSRQITAVFTSLISEDTTPGAAEVGISSLIDTWLLLRNLEQAGERNRSLYILKSRGMPHSNQIREFVLTNHGARLIKVAIGPDGIVTGSSREALQAREKSNGIANEQSRQSRRRSLDHKHTALLARLKALQSEFDAEANAVMTDIEQEGLREKHAQAQRSRLVQSRTERSRRFTPVKDDGK
ncbi:MAG: circadian clock protein KaiC [Candidatus Hydrogenedentes bacterium]|nr:circadian clock protein KaiC [Candidatus Hydrogenedentota bacterium]